MSRTYNNDIPENTEGIKKNIEGSIKAKTPEAARSLYFKASQRLLNVNLWKKYCGRFSATFQLTDAKGNPVLRHPKPGDHFKIDIPGPDTSAGQGFDWVEVEEVKLNKDENADEESLLIRVRPADNPLNADNDVAHFLSKKSTSSFMVKRKKNVVTVAVYGRNEMPNTQPDNLADKLRNIVIGTGAVAGFSNTQWERLVNGVLQKKSAFKASVPAVCVVVVAVVASFILFKTKAFKRSLHI